MAKKIQPQQPAKNDDKKSGGRAPRVSYMEVATSVNEGGKLTSVPEDFDTTKHLKPARDDFANPALFMEFRAAEASAKSEALAEAAEKYLAEAASLRKYGDPAKRKMAKRAQRLRDELADLEATLEEEGIDLDDEA